MLLTFVAERLFGVAVSRREWVGVGLTAVGLAFLAATVGGDAAGAHSHFQAERMVIFPLAIVVLVASLFGLLISARSLQLGDAIPMIAITSAAANLTTIAAGPLVFGESMPSSTLGLAVRVTAFAMVVVAASLTPPSQGSAGQERQAAAHASLADTL